MKKIVLLVTLLCYFTVSFCVPIALAGPSDFVNSIFNNAYSNVTTQSPSAFVSQGENIYSLGYSNVDFNSSGENIQLFSITPPSFSIGCSGISARFGAIAMLGSKLMQVLQEIISSGEVLVFAFNMVLGVLCKQCQNIMSQIESIANKLNGLNFSSCQAAEAMGNLAGAEVGNYLNKSGVAGITNSWADSVDTSLQNVDTSLNSYIGTINNSVNCLDNLTPQQIESGGQGSIDAAVEGECSQWNMASKDFLLGSFLRQSALMHAHLGLIAGTHAGSGGNDMMIAILRGSFTGDIVGFPNPDKKGEPALYYTGPHNVFGSNTSYTYSSVAVENAMHALVYGAQNMPFTTIDYGSNNFNQSGGLSSTPLEQVMSSGTICFVGFYPIYKYYLEYVEDQYFNPNGLSSITMDSSCGVAPTINEQVADNFVASSTLPVILMAKLAYVYDDPEILDDAAKAMAYGHALKIFTTILSAINSASGAHKNLFQKKNLAYINFFHNQVQGIIQKLRQAYNVNMQELSYDKRQIKYLQNLNQQWISALSNNGLSGAYNASSY